VVGTRKWPGSAFAGIRTFTLLGGLAGVAGWFWIQHLQPAAIVLLAGATALVVAAYIAMRQRGPQGDSPDLAAQSSPIAIFRDLKIFDSRQPLRIAMFI